MKGPMAGGVLVETFEVPEHDSRGQRMQRVTSLDEFSGFSGMKEGFIISLDIILRTRVEQPYEPF